MIATPGEPDLLVPDPDSFHEQTDEELTENDIKRMDADDQAIQTILLSLPEDVYAAVDTCETSKEIWERNGGIQIVQNAIQNAGVLSGGNQNGLVVIPKIANQNRTGNILAAKAEGTRNGNQARNYTARPRRKDAAYLQTYLLIAQKEEAGVNFKQKNLTSWLLQFVCDNNCSIKFDAFDFSVKDFMMRQMLLRCDSTGDLYPVTDPFSIPHVFLVSQHTWHQRLGHPGCEVLRHLVSSNCISCNKEKSLVLCRACQLGKHNNTWTLVPRPTDANIVLCMWLFRHKYLVDGTLIRYKARLMANGSTQL
nr:ribonuclease H-like domain-containing protein [Tanacetum cinerariifolium]